MLKEVPANTNLIFNDTQIPDTKVKEAFSRLKSLTSTRIEILNCPSMSEAIAPAIQETVNPSTAVLLPGNGAKSMIPFFSEEIQSLFRSDQSYLFPCQRNFINGKTLTGVNMSLPPELIVGINTGTYKNILIVDDVCYRGITISRIRNEIGVQLDREKPVPSLNWLGLFWLAYSQAITWGFSYQAAINYSKVVDKDEYNIPVNSLSSILDSSEIGKSKCLGYANQYFPQQDRLFLNAIEKLRNQL